MEWVEIEHVEQWSDQRHKNKLSVAFIPQANYTERPPFVGEI
jgi:peptidase E